MLSYSRLLLCLICFTLLIQIQLFSQNKFELNFKQVIDHEQKTLVSNFEYGGAKYKIQFIDVNRNGKLNDQGFNGDALIIYSTNRFKQTAFVYLKDTITITLFDKTFFITNLNKSIARKKLYFNEIAFSENADITIRNKMPNLVVKDLTNGKEGYIDSFLPDTTYKYFIINAWMSGCAPCEKEVKYLPELQKYGVGILNISTDDTFFSDKIFAAGHNMIGKNVYLEHYKLFHSFNISAFPSTILYSKDKMLIGYFFGITDLLNSIVRYPSLIEK